VTRIDHLNAGKQDVGKISDLKIHFKLFLQDRFYPDVEFYGWKKTENIYQTDIKARWGLIIIFIITLIL